MLQQQIAQYQNPYTKYTQEIPTDPRQQPQPVNQNPSGMTSQPGAQGGFGAQDVIGLGSDAYSAYNAGAQIGAWGSGAAPAAPEIVGAGYAYGGAPVGTSAATGAPVSAAALETGAVGAAPGTSSAAGAGAGAGSTASAVASSPYTWAALAAAVGARGANEIIDDLRDDSVTNDEIMAAANHFGTGGLSTFSRGMQDIFGIPADYASHNEVIAALNPIGGTVLLADMLGINLGTGKNPAQRQRDAIREAFSKLPGVGPDRTFRDITGTRTLQMEGPPPEGQIGAEALSLVNPLAHALGGGDENLTSAWGNLLAGAISSSALNQGELIGNLRGLFNMLNVTPEWVREQVAALDLDPETRAIFNLQMDRLEGIAPPAVDVSANVRPNNGVPAGSMPLSQYLAQRGNG